GGRPRRAGGQGGAERRAGAAPEDPRAGAGAGSEDVRARDRGGSIARLGVSERVARSRELVARGFAAAAVARVLQISRQAIYRTPTPRTPPQRRPVSDPVEQTIVEIARDNQTDGYRMVTAFVRRKLGVPVNRKRVL